MNWENPEGLCMDKVKRKLAHRFYFFFFWVEDHFGILQNHENGSDTISLHCLKILMGNQTYFLN